MLLGKPLNATTFESIQQSVRSIDLEAIEGNAAVPEAVTRTQRLVAVYRGVRPILAVVSTLPLLPPQFREPLKLFLFTFDQFVAGVAETSGDFKAGKDL